LTYNPSLDTPTLVGAKILASVAEPWDFTSEAGDNVLAGRVAAASAAADPVEWLLCEVAPFTRGERKVCTVAAVRRYRGDGDLLQRLRSGEAVGVNLLYDPAGQSLDAKRTRLALREQRGLEFLVGSLRVIP
jgi:hypothetical protein